MERTTTHRAKGIDGGTFTCANIQRGDLAGGYVCEAYRNGTRVFMRYLYYTRAEAVKLFKSHLAGA